MTDGGFHVVTGAFGFTGRYITGRLLEKGLRVKALTDSALRRNQFNGSVEAAPFNFDNPAALEKSLRGAEVLFNNYWVRFNHEDFSYKGAVDNTLTLFKAAADAGVKRIVHISITNPSEDSPFEYFRGKALLERALRESGLSYAIIRPAVIFGREDILINNIAWFVRKFPVFGVFGDGGYRLEPIFVGDLAELAVEMSGAGKNEIIDAVGPEAYTYRGLIREIADAIGRKRIILKTPPSLCYLAGRAISYFLDDVVITSDEIKGLMAGLLYTGSRPAGTTKLSEWLRANSGDIGKRYHGELKRRTDRRRSYEEL